MVSSGVMVSSGDMMTNGNMLGSGNMFGSALGCYQECYSWPEKEGMRGMIYYMSRCFIYLKELTQFIFYRYSWGELLMDLEKIRR